MVEYMRAGKPAYLIMFFLTAVVLGFLSSLDKVNILLFFVSFTFLFLMIIMLKQGSVNYFLLQCLFIIVGIENNFGVFGIGVLHLYLLLIMIIYFFSLIQKKDNNINPDYLSFYYVVIIYIFFSSFGYISTRGIVDGFLSALKTVILPTFLVFFLLREINSKKLFTKVIKVLIITSTIFSFIGIIQFLTNGMLFSGLLTNYRYLGMFNTMDLYLSTAQIQHIRAFVPGTDNFRVHGSFYAHNSFAAFVGSVAPLTFIFILNRGNKRVVYSIFLVIQTAAVYLTFSRGGLLTLILAYLIIFLFYNKNFKVIGMIVKGFAGLVVSFLLFIIFLIADINSSESRFLNFDFSNISELSDRFTIWKITIDQSFNNLWFGSSLDFLDKSLTSFLIFDDVSPHNLFLHILYSNGLFSLLLIIILLISQLFMFSRAFKSGIKDNDLLVLIVLFSSIVSFIGSGLMESLFINLNLRMLFWMLITLFFLYYKFSIKGVQT